MGLHLIPLTPHLQPPLVSPFPLTPHRSPFVHQHISVLQKVHFNQSHPHFFNCKMSIIKLKSQPLEDENLLKIFDMLDSALLHFCQSFLEVFPSSSWCPNTQSPCSNGPGIVYSLIHREWPEKYNLLHQ